MIPFLKIAVAYGQGMTIQKILRRNAILLPALFLATSLWGQTAGQNQDALKLPAGETAEVHLGRGYEALKQERYYDAAEDFRAALKIDATLVMRARFPLAIALFQLHNYVEARHELETVRKAAGERSSVCYYFGRIDLEEQNYNSAVANLNKAITNPPFPDTAYFLGFAYLKQGSNQEAEKWLKEAAKRNSDDSRADYQLGLLYRKEGREEEARQAFSRTKEQREQSNKLSQLKWDCAKELDKGISEQAIKICEQLYNPEDAEMLATLGVLYGQHGELERALKPLVRAAELAPQSAQMQYNLAYTYYQLGRYEEARAPLAGAVERWPDVFSLNAVYGAVLWHLGELLPACEALKRAHQLNSDDATTTDTLYLATLELAKKSEQSGSDAEALRYLKEATSLKPGEGEPHQRMVVIYTRAGNTDQAKAEQQKLNELNKPSNN
jgi:tetratricopeptide (TPR) repeat protein